VHTSQKRRTEGEDSWVTSRFSPAKGKASDAGERSKGKNLQKIPGKKGGRFKGKYKAKEKNLPGGGSLRTLGRNHNKRKK